MNEKENLIKILKDGGVAVMPTDTIYGLVGSALNKLTVERIYGIRQREENRPCIILIGDIEELGRFNINLSDVQKLEIQKHWPGSVSIIFDCPDDSLEYLHRGTKTLAFRLPKSRDLGQLLKETGPLTAPSANITGQPNAKNVQEAREYFDNSVDFYLDGGEMLGKASKILRLHKNGSVSILRE